MRRSFLLVHLFVFCAGCGFPVPPSTQSVPSTERLGLYGSKIVSADELDDPLLSQEGEAEKPPTKPAAPKEAEPSQTLLIGSELDKPVPTKYLRVSAELVSLAMLSEDKAVKRKYERPIQMEGVVKEIGVDERGKFIIFYTTLPMPFYLLNDEVKHQVERIKPGEKVGIRSTQGAFPWDE